MPSTENSEEPLFSSQEVTILNFAVHGSKQAWRGNSRQIKGAARGSWHTAAEERRKSILAHGRVKVGAMAKIWSFKAIQADSRVAYRGEVLVENWNKRLGEPVPGRGDIHRHRSLPRMQFQAPTGLLA